MQSNTSRVALVAGAVAVVVVAFLVLRPGDERDDGGTTAAERASTGAEQATPSDAPSERAQEGGGSATEQSAAPTARIRIVDGAVVGGTKEIEVERGADVELVVKSDAPDEIHLHGYDITRDVAPGRPARFSFTADDEGIYEIEAHDLGHVLIGELRVTPS